MTQEVRVRYAPSQQDIYISVMQERPYLIIYLHATLAVNSLFVLKIRM